MPRAAAPKQATAAKPKKPKAKKATAKTAAAPRRRVTLQPASGETLKQNATQLEVAERMLAEIASREQAEKDPAVAAQRALRAAIVSGAIPAGATILKAAPALKSQSEIDAEASLRAQKAAAKAARNTEKAQAIAAELAKIMGPPVPAPPVIALGAPVMGGPIQALVPPPPPPPIMPPTGPPVQRQPPVTRKAPPPVTADALAAAMAALTTAAPRAATAPVARVGPDPAALAAQAAKLALKFGKQEDRAAKIDAQRAARQAAQQEAASQQRVLERELVAAVARREEAQQRAREATREANNLAIQQMVDRAFAGTEERARAPATGTLALPVESPAAPSSLLADNTRVASENTNATLADVLMDVRREQDATLARLRAAVAARDVPTVVPRAPQMVSSGTQSGETGPRPSLGDNVIVYNQAGEAVSSYTYDSAGLRDRVAKGDIYQDDVTGRYVWRAGVKIPSQTRIRPVNNPGLTPAELETVTSMLEGSGLYGYGDTPPRPKTSASKSGRRVLPGYSHAQTLDALRSLVAQTNAQADALDRQNRRLQTQAETLRAYVPKTYATVTTQTDPMQPTMTVFNSKTMKPYTVSMATYQKNYNKGNIETDADGRPVFVAKAHRDANKMIADQEMEDYINELLADMPEPEGAGRSSDSRSEIQAAGFPADEWTPAQARKWMTEHGAKPIKGMRREGTWLRWRITPPDLYGSYTTKTLKSNGKTVHLILGWL